MRRDAPRHVFLVFEGGGAKGLAHLGALQAIEDAAPRLHPVAFAGTSAGAMVAALAAGGYRAAELFALPPARWRTLLDLLGLSDATALFGSEGWRRLVVFRRLYRHARAHALAHAGFGFAGLAALSGVGAVPVLAGLLALGATSLREAKAIPRGATSLHRVRDAFNDALREKGRGSGPDGAVTFADLAARRSSLKICATNITRGRLELFAAETTPDCPVAEAVAASICFPGAFRPWCIGDELFLDGGMLSNLPAWPFDEERRINPDALTIAFATVDRSVPGVPAPAPPTPEAWIGAGLRTLLFGAEGLSTRGAGQIEILRIPTALDVFDFDIDRDRALAEVIEARASAAQALRDQVLDVPRDFRLRCERAREEIRKALAAAPGAFASGRPETDIRVALALPEDHVAGGLVPSDGSSRQIHSLTYRFGAGFEGAADEGLVVPLRYRGRRTRSALSDAWHGQEPVFQAIAAPADGFGARFDRRRRALLRPGLAWVLCLPVTLPAARTRPVTLARYPGAEGAPANHDGTTVRGVLVVDGREKVAEDDEGLRVLKTALELIEKEITPIFAIK